jgi:hypothetical protein
VNLQSPLRKADVAGTSKDRVEARFVLSRVTLPFSTRIKTFGIEVAFWIYRVAKRQLSERSSGMRQLLLVQP